MRILACVLTGSMLTTEWLLITQGRWREAIPLHLCSVSAIAAVCYALSRGQKKLDFLWYLGVPGAALALLFPAPAASEFQPLMNTSYTLTHALIILIPLKAIFSGERVRRCREGWMLLSLHLLALAAFAANQLLGTDFLFLTAPPAGTPLSILHASGGILYLFALEALAVVMLIVTGRLLPRIFPSVMY